MICPRCGGTMPDWRPECPSCGARQDPPPVEREGLTTETKLAIGGFTGCLGLTCFLCVSLLIFASVPDLVGLPLTILAATVPAFVYVLAVIWLDRYEREPASVLLGAFFWGSVVAVVLAFLLEMAGSVFVTVVAGTEVADFALSVLGAPLIEEASKGLVLLLLFFLLKDEFDDTLDGIVYGSVVGLGFAMTENMTYFGRQYMEGGFPALAQLFVIRAVFSGLGHALYTGSTGAGLGFARETTNPALKILVPPLAFALGVGQHFLWNGLLQAIGNALPETSSFVALVSVVASMSVFLSGPAILVLLTIVILTWRREGRVINQYLAPEVPAGVISAGEYAVISSSWQRTLALYRALFTHGLSRWYYLRKLYQTETELAFLKWRAGRERRPRRLRQLAGEDHLRAEIALLRNKVASS